MFVFCFLPEYEGDEGDGNDKEVKQVEAWPAEGPRVKDEAVGNHFQAHFNGENSCEKVVKIVQDLQKRR